MNTTDIKNELLRLVENNEYRLSKDGTKTYEIIDAHFEVDKPYIFDIDWTKYFYLEWYKDDYDKRIETQYKQCVSKLVEDNATRQAVMVLVDPKTFYDKQDNICTFYIHCFLKDDTLIYIVNMRSNDCIEFMTDIIWNTKLRDKIAKDLSFVLGKEIKTCPIKWNAGSFHLYDKYLPEIFNSEKNT